VSPEQLANRNANISKGQARAWRDPEIRARRTTAIASAWDDPLLRAQMRERALQRGATPPRTTKKEENR
jgi:hypothetical protein